MVKGYSLAIYISTFPAQCELYTLYQNKKYTGIHFMSPLYVSFLEKNVGSIQYATISCKTPRLVRQNDVGLVRLQSELSNSTYLAWIEKRGPT